MAELRWHPLTKDWVMVASHRQNHPQMDDVATDIYKTAPSYGKWEGAVLYSPEHTVTLPELPENHVRKLLIYGRRDFRSLVRMKKSNIYLSLKIAVML